MKRAKLRFLITVVFVFILVIGMGGQALAAGNAGENGLGRYIVVFDEGVNEAAKDTLTARFGGVVGKEIALLGNANVVLLPPRAIEALVGSAEVLRVEEDAIVYALPKPDNPGKGKPPKEEDPPPAEVLPWGVDQVDAELAWTSSTGAGVNIAIIDTGIDLKHPDLAVAGGINIINPRKSAKDDNGHGTHVAGTVAALDNDIGVIGVAPDAALYAVKVLDRNGSGWLSDVILGIEWAISEDMDVINMSLGTSSDIQSLHDAVDAAYAAGIVVVAAAGNSGGAVIYPAAYDSVIAVSATDSNNELASFSSIGPEVELAAPGVAIYSTWKGGGYNTIDGTSMASPHVAGTVALVIASGIVSDTDGIYGIANEVRVQLNATADDIGLSDEEQGNGLVDAEEAATGIESP